MPRDLTISFRDPSTGAQHQLTGRVVDAVKNDSPQAENKLSMNPADGVVDLFVREESGKWTAPSTRHVQVDSSGLSSDAAKALQDAIASGDSKLFKVLEGRASHVTLRSDVVSERAELFKAGDDGVKLDAAGHFVVPNAQGSGLEQRIDGLHAAAEASDRLAEGLDLYTVQGADLGSKRANLASINEVLVQAKESGLDPVIQAKARSAAATNLAELMSGLGHEGEAGQLKAEAFKSYQTLVENETNRGLKESMIFNGVRIQSRLEGPEAKVVQNWRAEIAPTTPPYESFFKDGDRTLDISYAAGHGEGFYEGMTENMKKKGFRVIEEGDFRQPRILSKEINGKTINVHLRHFDNDSFKDINDPKMDIIAYGGHSNLGGNTRRSVANAPEGDGNGKLIFLGLCSGKDNLDRVRKTFPDAQLVTTFNSSYFTKGAKNGTQFTDGEDAKALNQIIEGVAHEKDWSAINKDIRAKAVGWNHGKELGNYITPIDLRVANRFRDSDRDGVADIQDRHFNLDVMNVKPSLSDEFSAKAPQAGTLNGDLPHLAAAFANTVDLYNPTFRNFSHKGALVADGYFAGGADQPVVRFQTTTVDGRKAYAMQVNDHYSHMGEESLRAVTMFEYNRHLQATESDYPIKDRKVSDLAGLTAAAASLKYDAGRRDSTVWAKMVEHYGLPEGVQYGPMRSLIMNEDHDYTGSERIARNYLDKLTEETQAQLTSIYGGE